MPKTGDNFHIGVFFDSRDEVEIAKALFQHIKNKTGRNNGYTLIRALHDYNLQFDDRGNRV